MLGIGHGILAKEVGAKITHCHSMELVRVKNNMQDAVDASCGGLRVVGLTKKIWQQDTFRQAIPQDEA